jgi:hypothetical protein
MNVNIVTAASEEYFPLADITGKRKAEYAAKRNWRYRICGHKKEGMEIMWERPEIWSREVRECDWMLFMGADVGITNLKREIKHFLDLEADLILTVAPDGGIENDGFIARNCLAVRRFFDSIPDLRGWADIQNDSDAMTALLAGGSCTYGELRSEIDAGANLLGVYNRSNVRVALASTSSLMAPLESHCYGDFAVHLIRRSLRDRIKWFEEHFTT